MSITTLLSTLVLTCASIVFAATPKEVCDSLAKSAREDNFAAFEKLTFAGNVVTKAKKFHTMHKDNMGKLKDLNCGTETVAGTHAIVEASSQNEKRLVPFVEVGGTWKFDIATYKTFYRKTAKN